MTGKGASTIDAFFRKVGKDANKAADKKAAGASKEAPKATTAARAGSKTAPQNDKVIGLLCLRMQLSWGEVHLGRDGQFAAA